MQPFTWNHVLFLILAARWTILLSLVGFVAGGTAGALVTVARVQTVLRPLRAIAATYIYIIQGTPLLMQMFLIYFGLSYLGLDLDAWVSVSIALTLHVSAFLAEIWRGCLEAVPKGQTEAAVALSLPAWKRMRLVVIPQALRIAIPPTVGFLVQVIKGTSLASVVGFVEIMRAGQLVSNTTFHPLIVYLITMCLYFALCWPLSLLSRKLEQSIRLRGYVRDDVELRVDTSISLM